MALDKYTRDILLGILITVITIVIANAWNAYIIQGIDNYFKNNTNKAKLWKTIYLIVITALALFFILYVLPRIGFSLKQVSESGKERSKVPGTETTNGTMNGAKGVIGTNTDIVMMY